MKKFLIAATALSGLLAFVGSASAADLAAPVAPVYDWTGFYAGLQGGYGFGEIRWSETSGPVETDKFDFEGFVGGATVGGNMQVNNIVFGVEGDVSFSDIDGTGDTSGGFNCNTGCETEVSWFGTARGRLGYALDATLPYVTGGFAFGDAKGEVSSLGTIGKDTLTGWTAGAGIEHAFTPYLSAKVEYLYTDLGKLDLPDNCNFNCSTDIKFSVVRIGVNFQF